MSQITKNGQSFNTVVIVDPLTGLPSSNTGGGGSGGTTTATATVVLLYSVMSAFSGASVGDIVSNTQIINTSDGTVSSETWTNLTTNLSLASAPAASAISLQSTQPLTNAQLTALLGSQADAAWGGTGNGSLFGLLKAIWTKLTDGNQKTRLVDNAGNAASFTSAGLLNVNNAGSSFSYSSNNSTNGNSTAVAIANAGSWNGTLENTINQSYAIIGVVSDKAVTLNVDQFLDNAGSTQDVPRKSFTIAAGVAYSLPLAVLGNYLKVSVANASGAAANVRVDTYYGNLPVQPDTLTQQGNFRVAVQEALPVGSNQLGAVLGRTGQPSVSPAITSASVYAAGNIVGGLMTFNNAFANSSGILQSIIIKSKSIQTSAFKLYLFSQQPTNSTWTDKTAPAINALDLAYLVDFFIFAAPDSGLGTMTIYSQDGLGKAIANTAGGNQLYGVLVAVGTPTFNSSSDISVALGVIQD